MTEPLTIRQRIQEVLTRAASDPEMGFDLAGRIVAAICPEGVPVEDFGRWKSVEERGPQTGAVRYFGFKKEDLDCEDDDPRDLGERLDDIEERVMSSIGILKDRAANAAERIEAIEARLSPPRHPDWGSEEEGSRDPFAELVQRVQNLADEVDGLVQRSDAHGGEHLEEMRRQTRLLGAILDMVSPKTYIYPGYPVDPRWPPREGRARD